MDEKELVLKSREGDEEAFAVLVNSYKKKVFHMAYSMTRNHTLADDLAQEIFIKALFSLRKFRFQSEFSTWLYRIASNHIIDCLRKKKRQNLLHQKLKADFPVQDETFGKKEDQEKAEEKLRLVYKALETLSPRLQIVVSLRDIQGFSYEEIGRMLNLSPGTVDSRLHRARKKLREKVASYLSQKGGG